MSSADQTLKTLLVFVSARQHTAISGFHIRRPTLVLVRLQSPDQRHETDYTSNNPIIRHSSEFQEPIESSLLLMDRFFFFSIHLERRRP